MNIYTYIQSLKLNSLAFWHVDEIEFRWKPWFTCKSRVLYIQNEMVNVTFIGHTEWKNNKNNMYCLASILNCVFDINYYNSFQKYFSVTTVLTNIFVKKKKSDHKVTIHRTTFARGPKDGYDILAFTQWFGHFWL